MADVLTAADISELRREWVVDEIDERPEWGSGGAKVGVLAAVGASSVSLTALGDGTVKKGTRFSILSGTTENRYAATADATITATAATVYVSPLLVQAVAVNDVVKVEKIYRSYFNRVYKRLMFSDVDMEELSRRAEETWGARIHDSRDPRRLRFEAISALALKQQETDAEFYAAVIQYEAQDGGSGFYQRLTALRREYEADLSFNASGPVYGVASR